MGCSWGSRCLFWRLPLRGGCCRGEWLRFSWWPIRVRRILSLSGVPGAGLSTVPGLRFRGLLLSLYFPFSARFLPRLIWVLDRSAVLSRGSCVVTSFRLHLVVSVSLVVDPMWVRCCRGVKCLPGPVLLPCGSSLQRGAPSLLWATHVVVFTGQGLSLVLCPCRLLWGCLRRPLLLPRRCPGSLCRGRLFLLVTFHVAFPPRVFQLRFRLGVLPLSSFPGLLLLRAMRGRLGRLLPPLAREFWLPRLVTWPLRFPGICSSGPTPRMSFLLTMFSLGLFLLLSR